MTNFLRSLVAVFVLSLFPFAARPPSLKTRW